MKKSRLVIIVLCFLISHLTLAQTTSLNKFRKILGTSRTQLSSFIFILNDKAYSYEFDESSGFFIYSLDEKTIPKKILVRDLNNVNTTNFDEVGIVYLGHLNNKAFFITQYHDSNPANSSWDMKGELWSFDGEHITNIPYPSEVYSYLNNGALVFTNGTNFFYNSKYIFISSSAHSPNYGDKKKSPVFFKFDGEKFEADYAYNLMTDDKLIPIASLVFKNSLVLKEYNPEADSKNRKSHLWIYDGKLAKIIDESSKGYRDFLYQACGKFYFFKNEWIGDCPTNDCEYEVNLYTIGSEALVKTLPSEITFHTQAIMSYRDRLIFGLYNNDGKSAIPPKASGLYITDGTLAGTKLLSAKVMLNKNQTGYDEFKSILSYTEDSGKLFFTVYDNSSSQIWQTDGTEKGTILMKRIDGKIGPLKVINGNIIYSKKINTKQYLLWQLVSNNEVQFSSDPIYSEDSYDILANGKFYFVGGLRRSNLNVYI